MDNDRQQILAVQRQISLDHHKSLSTFPATAQQVLHAPQNDNFPTTQKLHHHFSLTLTSTQWAKKWYPGFNFATTSVNVH